MHNKWKKRIRIALLLAAAGALAVLLGIHFFLGAAVKAGVQSYMPKLTGTDVKMDGFYFNTLNGKLAIDDFLIGNPEGYKTGYAFKLGSVTVDIDMTTVLSNKLVIQQILVDKAHVIYETGLGTSNIGQIQSNIKKYSSSGKDGASAETADKKRGESRKIQIDDFLLKDSKVSLSAVLLQGGKATLPLPAIHLEGIGSDKEGTTWNQAIMEIYSAIFKSVSDVAGSAGNIIKETGKGAFDAIKDVFE